jgi:ABC-type methionine transport system ATPase subunit
MNAPAELDGLVLAAPGDEPVGPMTWRMPPGVWAVLLSSGCAAALVRACTGTQKPVRGRVLVLGIDPASCSRAERQRLNRRCTPWLLPPALLSNATIRSTIALPMRHDPAWRQDEVEQRVDEVLELCGITRWAWRRPADVPPPARTLASLARALGPRPELLVTDDFASRMDREQCASIVSMLRSSVPAVMIATAVPQRIGAAVDGVVDPLQYPVPEAL